MTGVSRDRVDLAEWRTAVASGGAALSTTKSLILFPKGTQFAALRPQTFVVGVVAKIAVLPFLSVLRTNDDLATAAVDDSDRAQDGDGATHVTLSSLPTLANGGFVLMGAIRPFRGVAVTMDAQVNGNPSVLTVQYWNGSAWTDIGATDGTANAGATFGQTGDVTWTVPTAWKRTALVEIPALRAKALASIPGPHAQEPLMWTRWTVSAALDAATLVDAMVALARSTAYAELQSGQDHELYVRPGIGGNAGIEALTNAGTAKLMVNVAAGSGGFD